MGLSGPESGGASITSSSFGWLMDSSELDTGFRLGNDGLELGLLLSSFDCSCDGGLGTGFRLVDKVFFFLGLC